MLAQGPRRMSRIFKGMNCACTIQNPDALFICAKAKRQQQLRQGEIDTEEEE